ncbi:MAG: hypothetical protein ACM3XS_00850 [Bacteroidota bacterium]
MTTPRASRNAQLLVGLGLIGLGAVMLLSRLAGLTAGRIWPFFVLLPGVLFFSGLALDGHATVGWLAIPGSVLIVLSLLLFYQNLTGHWESWAYAWALVMPTSVGIGLAIQGRRSGERHVRETGAELIRTGLAVFAVMGAFFELVLNISRFRSDRLGGIAWSALLIAVGLYLLCGRGRIWYDRRSSASPPPGKTGDKPLP